MRHVRLRLPPSLLHRVEVLPLQAVLHARLQEQERERVSESESLSLLVKKALIHRYLIYIRAKCTKLPRWIDCTEY